MNKTLPIVSAALLGLVSAGPASAYKITWTGAADGSDAFNEGNWKLETTQAPPAAGSVDPGNPIGLIIEVGTSAFTANASAGAFTIGATGLLQVGGGAFTTTSVIRRDATPGVNDDANVSLIVSNSSQSTGQVTAAALYEINVSLINELTLTESDDPLRFSQVSFAASLNSGTSLRLTGESVDDVVAEHVSKFTVNGAPAQTGLNPSIAEPGDNLRIVSDGLLGSIITPVTTPIMPGDTDGDGDIDDADLGTAFSNFTGPVPDGDKTHTQGDTDNDGDIDDADLGTLFSSFTGPQAPVAPVPEPMSGVMLTVALALLSHRRRRAIEPGPTRTSAAN